MLDSFTELIPGHSKKATDHYILYKCVNQVWLRYDNEVVKKANLAGHFRVNLAFFLGLCRPLIRYCVVLQIYAELPSSKVFYEEALWYIILFFNMYSTIKYSA